MAARAPVLPLHPLAVYEVIQLLVTLSVEEVVRIVGQGVVGFVFLPAGAVAQQALLVALQLPAGEPLLRHHAAELQVHQLHPLLP